MNPRRFYGPSHKHFALIAGELTQHCFWAARSFYRAKALLWAKRSATLTPRNTGAYEIE